MISVWVRRERKFQSVWVSSVFEFRANFLFSRKTFSFVSSLTEVIFFASSELGALFFRVFSNEFYCLVLAFGWGLGQGHINALINTKFLANIVLFQISSCEVRLCKKRLSGKCSTFLWGCLLLCAATIDQRPKAPFRYDTQLPHLLYLFHCCGFWQKIKV